MTQSTVTTRDIYGEHYEVPISQLIWRPAAYAIIVKDNKLVLMKAAEALSGYHMPGGGIEFGESPEEAVVREAKEEAGLDISNVQLAGTLSSFFTDSHKADKKTHFQSLLLYYTCDLAEGELSSDGHQADEKQYGLTPEWIPIDQLDSISVGSTVDWRPIITRALGI